MDLQTAEQDLLRKAHQLLAMGQAQAAEALYQQLLSQGVAKIEALNGMAMAAVRRGQLPQAAGILRRALEVDAGDILTLTNLAQTCQALGNRTEAIGLYESALRLQPSLYTARLSLARLLEEAGDSERAVPRYFRAIVDAQRDGRWLSAESTPAGLQPVVAHAFNVVDRERSRLFRSALEPARERFGASELVRVDQALRIYLGELKAGYADRRQKPTFLYFPGLPAAPYLDKSAVPELQVLEAAAPMIRAELDAILQDEAGSEAVFGDRALESANLRGTRGTPKWTGYYFHRYGEPRVQNLGRCPHTRAALEALPLCRVRQHGPETLFSILAPGTHLLPHRGVTNTRIVGHLALIVPPDCRLRVADTEYAWVEGETVIFDDTYMHEAWNRSNALRVVLIFDLWNPYLTLPERAALSDLVSAIGDFRLSADLPIDGQL